MEQPATTDEQAEEPRKGLLSRHPRLAILLIAGVFYAILFGMCAVVVVLVFRG